VVDIRQSNARFIHRIFQEQNLIMPKMRAAQVARPGGPFEIVQRELPQRVGVGWHGGHCGHCDACRSGDFSQDTLAFGVLAGVRSVNEVYALEKVGEVYDRMLSGKARFRVVLTTGQ
jgi:hypothetical protein